MNSVFRAAKRCAALFLAIFTLGACLFLPAAGKAALPAAANGNSFIKWVDFGVTCDAMSDALKLDIASHETEAPVSWIDLLAVLGAKYGGNFKKYKKADLLEAETALRNDKNAYDSTKYYAYYKEAYGAVLGGLVGEYALYEEKDGGYTLTEKYGLRGFSPIAKGYTYGDFDDFGVSRSFGYRRRHLGHDMMGSVGTPIIAVESGYVEAAGWNPYGGWRIGIRSNDGKRYYYYAHLRRGHPYNDIYEGKQVTAGEVIGYLGMTGYSRKEDTNNIDTPHLHFGLQLIFDPSQKEGNGEIWVDCYELTKFLSRHKSAVYREGNEYYPVSPIFDPSVPD